MGKNGELLRKQKMDNTKYTFTRAQLDAHDKAVMSNYRELVQRETKAEVNRYIEQEWKAREEALGGQDEQDRFFNILNFLLCTSSKVLIEQFGFPPIPNINKVSSRNKTLRFANALVEEINMITDDDKMDIRRYNSDVYDKYGIRFVMQDE